MRTREDKIDDHYLKILPQREKQENIKKIPEIDLKPSLSPYERQLNNSKSYYQKIEKIS